MSNTVKIRKGNKVKYVEAGRLDAFLKQGYEQIDEKGSIIKRATGGSSIPIAKYNQLLDELEEFKGSDQSKQIEELKKENTALKGKVTKLENAAKEGQEKK